MLRKSTDSMNIAMWCRMLNSRVYLMAGAAGVISMRLKTI